MPWTNASGATYGACVDHVTPGRSWAGPSTWLVVDGDPIGIDVAARRLDLEVGPATLDRRRQAWKAPEPRYARGFLASTPSWSAGPTRTRSAVESPSRWLSGIGPYRWLPRPAR
jgi:dihydroxyacid dehydratase/phosphogluconate dehydratase